MNQTITYSLIIFLGIIPCYWAFVKLLKYVMRSPNVPINIRGFAFQQFAGKYSGQENFGAIIFANLVVMCIIASTVLAVQQSADRLQNSPKPTHYIADIQPDQIMDFKNLLLENNAQELAVYPLIRARITKHNGAPTRSDDSWIYRGDRFFGADQDATLDLQTNGDIYEIAVDQTLAEKEGLKRNDHLSISVLGEEIELQIKKFRNTQSRASDLDFPFILPDQAFESLPHIFLSSASFKPDQQDTLNQIIDRFPNVIIVSTDAALKRVDLWVSQLLKYIYFLGVYILSASFITLLCVSVLIMRRERYDQTLLDVFGMKTQDKIRIQIVKIFLNATLATLASFIILLLFNHYVLAALTTLDIQLDFGKIFSIVFIFGLFCAMIPSIMSFFSRSNQRKLEEFAQDFEQLKLDF